MESLNASRVLMGDSLGFHILFVLMSLTLPILVSWFEFKGLTSRNKRYLDVARFWSKIMGLLVVAGVVSGTIIAIQMSLVWPGILKFGGDVIGLPFMFETYAFLIEATFLALYMTTWDKVKPWLHWAFGLFIILGSTLSAYAITSVNAWMNYPTGFRYVNGEIVDANVWDAMFSRTSIVEFIHSMPAYYLTGCLVVAGLYAIRIARAKYRQRYSKSFELDWLIVRKLMTLALVLFVTVGITADITGKYLARYEPSKLAAIELNHETQSNAPLLIGGVGREDGTVAGPHFEIPGGLSLLAGNSTEYVVQGLNETPKEERPPLVVHTLFDIKMTFVNILMVTIPGFFVLYYFKRQWLYKRWALYSIMFSGILAACIIELGWMLTEIGRQPWAVRGYVTTEQAVTKTHDVTSFGYAFPLAYVALFIVTVLAIRKLVAFEKERSGSTLR